jgi:hypothetical protein
MPVLSRLREDIGDPLTRKKTAFEYRVLRPAVTRLKTTGNHNKPIEVKEFFDE